TWAAKTRVNQADIGILKEEDARVSSARGRRQRGRTASRNDDRLVRGSAARTPVGVEESNAGAGYVRVACYAKPASIQVVQPRIQHDAVSSVDFNPAVISSGIQRRVRRIDEEWGGRNHGGRTGNGQRGEWIR